MTGDIPRLRRVTSGEPEPADDTATAPEPGEPGNVVRLPGTQATPAGGFAGQAVAGMRQRARDLKRRDGNVIKGLRNSVPSTVEQQAQWTRDRRWRESGVEEGSWADVENSLYYRLLGNPLAALCLALAAIFQRQGRLALALVIGAPLVPLLIWLVWLVA